MIVRTATSKNRTVIHLVAFMYAQSALCYNRKGFRSYVELVFPYNHAIILYHNCKLTQEQANYVLAVVVRLTFLLPYNYWFCNIPFVEKFSWTGKIKYNTCLFFMKICVKFFIKKIVKKLDLHILWLCSSDI